jgi:hypothetical protein
MVDAIKSFNDGIPSQAALVRLRETHHFGNSKPAKFVFR